MQWQHHVRQSSESTPMRFPRYGVFPVLQGLLPLGDLDILERVFGISGKVNLGVSAAYFSRQVSQGCCIGAERGKGENQNVFTHRPREERSAQRWTAGERKSFAQVLFAAGFDLPALLHGIAILQVNFAPIDVAMRSHNLHREDESGGHMEGRAQNLVAVDDPLQRLLQPCAVRLALDAKGTLRCKHRHCLPVVHC